MLLTKVKELRRPFCKYPFQKIKIDSSGKCNFCCFQRIIDGAPNILEQSLEDIWNSEVAQQIREDTLNGVLHSACSTPACPFFHIIDEAPKLDVQCEKMPFDIELDLPMQHCNIGGENPKPNTACIMCERNLFFQKQEDRVDEICDKLKPYASNIKFLHIQGVAEAFWKDRIFEVVERIGVDVTKTRITTFTNGTILGGERLTRWLKYPWTCTTFSIDAATPETYKKIRIWDAYHRIVTNMMEFARKRGPSQSLQIHNNINLFNINEVVGMVELASKVGADYISFNPTHHLKGAIVSKENAHLFKKAQEQILETADKLKVNVDFLRNLALDFEIEEENFVNINDIKFSS